MHRLPSGRRSPVLQLLDHRDHPHPHCLPVEIPGLKAPVGLLSREDRRVLTVLVDEELYHPKVPAGYHRNRNLKTSPRLARGLLYAAESAPCSQVVLR